jgi:hypothetical protein
MSPPPGERTHVAYLILAEAVENVDGRLNITGGGWDKGSLAHSARGRYWLRG